MKKFAKIMLAFVFCFMFALTPFAFVGCGEKDMTLDEFSDMTYAAAKNYYPTHRDVENFADVTYHFTVNTTNKLDVTLDYKNNAEDEEMVKGTFEDKTVTTEEYYIAIKKIGEDVLHAQLKVNVVTTITSNDVDENDLLTTTTTVTEDKTTYTLTTYTDADETYYGLFEETSHQVGNADAVVTKKYETLANKVQLVNQVLDYVLDEVNDRMDGTFFGLEEMILVYSSAVNVKKDGNKTNISFGYNMTRTNNANIYRIGMNYEVKFADNKAVSARGEMNNVGETSSSYSVTTFDYANTATIDDVVLADYTAGNVLANYQDLTEDLPELFGF